MIFTKKDYIEIDDKKIPVKFNMKVFHQFATETDIPFFKYLETVSKGDILNSNTTALIYHALVEGHKIEGKEMEFTREEVDSIDIEYVMPFIEKLTAAIEKLGNGQQAQLKAEANKNRKAKA
jgi:hypothetical protein